MNTEKDDQEQIEFLNEWKQKQEDKKHAREIRAKLRRELIYKIFHGQEPSGTKKEALAILRKEIKKEPYYQDKIKKALKAKYPKAYVVKISQSMYSQAGIPDIMMIYCGHYFGFEVKTSGGWRTIKAAGGNDPEDHCCRRDRTLCTLARGSHSGSGRIRRRESEKRRCSDRGRDW